MPDIRIKVIVGSDPRDQVYMAQDFRIDDGLILDASMYHTFADAMRAAAGKVSDEALDLYREQLSK